MIRTLKVGSWNVRGLVNPHRALIDKHWLHRCYNLLEIFCLQERQASMNSVSFHLQSIFPNGKSKIDSLDSGLVGSALLVAPHVVVLNQRSKGDGSLAWVKSRLYVVQST
jgi:hypothetical protein